MPSRIAEDSRRAVLVQEIFLAVRPPEKTWCTVIDDQHCGMLRDELRTGEAGRSQSLLHLQRGQIEHRSGGFVCERIRLACVLDTIGPIACNRLSAPQYEKAMSKGDRKAQSEKSCEPNDCRLSIGSERTQALLRTDRYCCNEQKVQKERPPGSIRP